MELDQLCRLLVQQGPAHLNEGGYMQMLWRVGTSQRPTLGGGESQMAPGLRL